MFADDLEYKVQDVRGWNLKPDILIHGSPCLAEGTMVLTKDGYKKIEDVNIGDLVLDHTNSYHRVSAVLDQGFKDVVKIKCKQAGEIIATPNHKFLVRTKNKDGSFSDSYWKEVDYLNESDYLGVAINQESETPLSLDGSENLDNPAFWHEVGKFLAGSTPHTTYDDIESMFFGAWANGYIPAYILDLPQYCLYRFLTGFLNEMNFRNCEFDISSSNESTARMLQAIATKVYHQIYSFKKFHTLEGKYDQLNQLLEYQYSLTIPPEIGLCGKCGSGEEVDSPLIDGQIWVSIDSIIPLKEKQHVYDLTVENSHSFTANGIISHNCQDFSIAGHQKGADPGSETSSSLMWETLQIIKHMGEWKPKVVIWENVKNVLSKHMRHNFDKYLAEMEAMGYSNSYELLNAKDFGLPQNRERVFTISILGSEPFDFKKLERKPMADIKEYLESDDPGPQYIVRQPSMIKKIGKPQAGPFKGFVPVITDCAQTITTAQMRCPNAGVIKLKNGQYRYLTERETFRLQGYSDRDYEAAKSANPSRAGCMNGALYKQAGNSMPVPIMEGLLGEVIRCNL